MGQISDIINMYFVTAPFFLRWYYPKITFNKSRKERKIFLTFDDGPIPEVTPRILDILAAYDIKATFFCVGDNIEKYRSIYERIRSEGHQVGNHTYNHLRGWDTEDNIYLNNIAKCQQLTGTSLFRPPYARAKKTQLKALYERYEVIFWDVLSGDFDEQISPEKCYQNVIKHVRSGSIIVFHDNIKALPRVTYALPKVISYLKRAGYDFGVL